VNEAIALADRASALHPDSPAFANQRCWTRAIAGRELDIALEACNGALSQGERAAVLDSRALVYLKTGRFQEAWNDYDTAVGMSPLSPQFLFGRGIAALRLGRESEGRADLTRAGIMEGGIALDYAAKGIVP